jgi:hypothetical protein
MGGKVVYIYCTVVADYHSAVGETELPVPVGENQEQTQPVGDNHDDDDEEEFHDASQNVDGSHGTIREEPHYHERRSIQTYQQTIFYHPDSVATLL